MTTFHIAYGSREHVRHFYGEDAEELQAIETVWGLEATDNHGRRWVLNGHVGDEAEAKFLATEIGDPEQAPDEWLEVDPVYGSAAWDGYAEEALAQLD